MGPVQINQGNLQQKLFYCSLLGGLVLCILVASVAIIPLYNALLEQEHQNLRFSHELQSGRTEQYFNSLKGIADQITSRSRIRQELEKYNAGEISLAALQKFTGPKLQDALAHSPEAKGISRYDHFGNQVVTVGLSYQRTEQRDKAWENGVTSLTGPVLINETPYVLVTAPIKNRDNKTVGKDEVLFDLNGLNEIAKQHLLGNQDSNFILAYRKDSSFSWFPLHLPENLRIDVPINREINNILNETYKGETGIQAAKETVLDFGKPTIAYGLVSKEYKFPLLIITNPDTIYENIMSTVFKVCLVILILLVFASAGLILLLRPLKNKALVYQKELEKEVQELQEIIPICMYCKNIRDDEGYWDRIESYIAKFSEVEFSHGICDGCMEKHYPHIKTGSTKDEKVS
jgi:hypothetical protein